MLCWPTTIYAKFRDETLYFESYFGFERPPNEELSDMILKDIILVEAQTDSKPSMKVKVAESTFSPRKTYTIAGRTIVVDVSRIPRRIFHHRRRV